MQLIIIALSTMNDSIPVIFIFVLPTTHPTSIHSPNNDDINDDVAIIIMMTSIMFFGYSFGFH